MILKQFLRDGMGGAALLPRQAAISGSVAPWWSHVRDWYRDTMI